MSRRLSRAAARTGDLRKKELIIIKIRSAGSL